MDRRRYPILIIALLVLLSGCKHNSNTPLSQAETKAIQLADSIHNIDSLLSFAQKYHKQKEKRAECVLREAIGKLYREQNDFENAIIQHDSAINLSTALRDTILLVKSLNQQGTNFRRMGDMEMAVSLHSRALELCEETASDTTYKARKNKVVSLNGLGNILLSMGNYDAAENTFRDALAGEQSLESVLGEAINYANLGSIFEHRNELDSALVYYKLSMQKNREIENATGIGLCHQYLGHIDELLGNTSAAMEQYKKSYEILIPTNDPWHWMEASIALAQLYLNTNNADSARKYIDITLNAADAIHSKEHRSNAYLLKYEYEEKWGTCPQALYYYKRGHAIDDSLMNEKNYNKIQNLRVNYEIKRRSAELEQAKNEAKLEQRIRHLITWIGVFVVLLLAGIVILLSRLNNEKKKSNIALQKIYSERQEFYRNIAHRFRTPLTVVIGMTQQLREHINKEDVQAQGDFAAVERQNAELLRLVNEMMHKLQPNATTATTSIVNGEVREWKKNEITNEKSDEKSLVSTFAIPNEDGTKPIVLLAEDNEDVARYQCELLEYHGYKVNWASDGLLALQLIDEELPNIIITDIMMPNMDGLELCRNIRSNSKTAHLPLIIVTARVEDRDRMKGLEAGAEVYLTKPFLGRELLLNMKNLLQQRFFNKSSEKENKEVQENATTEVTASKFITMLNEVIDTNLSDPSFSSTLLAAHMCLSRSQLNRRVNSELGTDTSHYIRERRLEHACQLLKKSELSIMDVQVACGFDSPAYFSRVFKQRFNMSPTEYRKQT